MRNLVAILLLSFAAALPGVAVAADFPETPYIAPDYGLGEGWYIRGSKSVSLDYFPDIQTCACSGTSAEGWNWSVGAGFGYEFDNGFRVDKTFDYMVSTGETDAAEAYTLRMGLVLANAYVDFGLGDNMDAGGGWVGYFGAGAGGAWYDLTATGSAGGTGWTWAAAAMAGIGYDMGSDVIDFGYRFLYLNELMTDDPATIPGGFGHELRVSWRHRIN